MCLGDKRITHLLQTTETLRAQEELLYSVWNYRMSPLLRALRWPPEAPKAVYLLPVCGCITFGYCLMLICILSTG